MASVPPIDLEGTRYRLAGRRGAILLSAFAGALLVSPPFAFLHAYVAVEVPGGSALGPLLALALGSLLGLSNLLIVRLARCRSPRALAIVTAGTGVLAVYTSWVAFEWRLLGPPDPLSALVLFADPGRVLEQAVAIHGMGGPEVFGWLPAGALLAFLWLAEALVVMTLTVALPVMGLLDQVFCERCDRWSHAARQSVRLPGESGPDVCAALSDRGLAAIDRLEALCEDDSHFVRLDLRSCGGCRATAAARVWLVQRELLAGRVRERASALTDRLVISARSLRRLEALGGGS